MTRNQFLTATDMAKAANVHPKRFRDWLRRDQRCSAWHTLGKVWLVTAGSQQHADMLRVLNELQRSDEQ